MSALLLSIVVEWRKTNRRRFHGKRCLLGIKAAIDSEPEWFKVFYYIRAEAEGILKEERNHG